jgi:hypothetical protein
MMRIHQLLGARSNPSFSGPFSCSREKRSYPRTGSEFLPKLETAIVNRLGLKGTTHEPPELQNVFVEPIREGEALPA